MCLVMCLGDCDVRMLEIQFIELAVEAFLYTLLEETTYRPFQLLSGRMLCAEKLRPFSLPFVFLEMSQRKPSLPQKSSMMPSTPGMEQNMVNEDCNCVAKLMKLTHGAQKQPMWSDIARSGRQ